MRYSILVLALGVFMCVDSLKAQNPGGISIASELQPPNPHAMLDVVSEGKGALLPRLNLNNFSSAIGPSERGLIVFNDTPPIGQGDYEIGYHFFDGDNWVPFGATYWKCE